jgi:hypothetical protein
LRQAFGPAQAAAGAAGQTAPMQLERLGTLGGELHAHFNALRLFDDFEIEDFAGAADDALAEAEAEREIFKFAGGGQHHGMRNSVVHQSHRHFLGEDFGTGKSARRRAPAGRVAAMGLLFPACCVVHQGLLLHAAFLAAFLLRYSLYLTKAIFLYHIRLA